MDLSFNSFEIWVTIGIAIGALVIGIPTGMRLSYGFLKKKMSSLWTDLWKKEAEKEAADIGKMDFAVHTVIHENITGVRIESGADRCQVGQFHNGGKFLDGSPMKRFSVTHESCRSGFSFEYGSFQGVLATLFFDMVDAIKRDDATIILTESLPDSSATKTYNRSRNIEAFSVLPLKKGELFVGFIRMDWTDITSLPQYQSDFEKMFRTYRSIVELELVKKG